jgi:hypothetical protein
MQVFIFISYSKLSFRSIVKGMSRLVDHFLRVSDHVSVMPDAPN